MAADQGKIFIVAEIGAAHNGTYENAQALIRHAADAGADAIKVQCYTPESMVIDRDYTITEGPWAGEKLYDLYEGAQTPRDWIAPLFEFARDYGLEAFSSVYDLDGLDFLESIDCPRYKIASFELVDLHLLERVAETGKPMVLSTGMASEREIDDAVGAVYERVTPTLLHCVSAYPTEGEDADLGRIAYLKERYGMPVGLSDHSLGTHIPACAAAYGIQILEKHLCLSRGTDGPDDAFSLEPEEFAETVSVVRTITAALDKPSGAAEGAALALRRSLWSTRPIARGTRFSDDNIGAFRPALGLRPGDRSTILGKRAARDIASGQALSWEMVDGGTPEEI